MTAVKTLSSQDMNSQKIVGLGAGTNPDEAVNKGQLDAGVTAAESRANHTGTQSASTINDFDAQVRLSRLDQMAAPTNDVGMNGHQLTGLADGSTNTAAVTLQQLNAALAGLSTGLAFKGVARVATNSNVTIASPGASVDGVAMTAGDVVWLNGQTTGSQGGPWVWNGAAVPMTRPTNWDTTAEAVPGSLWVVRQGTFDNQLLILSNDTFVLGTDTPVAVFINPAAASDNDTGYTETCPVTAAGAAWAVNHNLGTKAVSVQVYRTASPYDQVNVQVTRDTSNQVNVRPDVALALGEFTVVVAKVV